MSSSSRSVVCLKMIIQSRTTKLLLLLLLCLFVIAPPICTGNSDSVDCDQTIKNYTHIYLICFIAERVTFLNSLHRQSQRLQSIHVSVGRHFLMIRFCLVDQFFLVTFNFFNNQVVYKDIIFISTSLVVFTVKPRSSDLVLNPANQLLLKSRPYMNYQTMKSTKLRSFPQNNKSFYPNTPELIDLKHKNILHKKIATPLKPNSIAFIQQALAFADQPLTSKIQVQQSKDPSTPSLHTFHQSFKRPSSHQQHRGVFQVCNRDDGNDLFNDFRIHNSYQLPPRPSSAQGKVTFAQNSSSALNDLTKFIVRPGSANKSSINSSRSPNLQTFSPQRIEELKKVLDLRRLIRVERIPEQDMKNHPPATPKISPESFNEINNQYINSSKGQEYSYFLNSQQPQENEQNNSQGMNKYLEKERRQAATACSRRFRHTSTQNQESEWQLRKKQSHLLESVKSQFLDSSSSLQPKTVSSKNPAAKYKNLRLTSSRRSQSNSQINKRSENLAKKENTTNRQGKDGNSTTKKAQEFAKIKPIQCSPLYSKKQLDRRGRGDCEGVEGWQQVGDINDKEQIVDYASLVVKRRNIHHQ